MPETQSLRDAAMTQEACPPRDLDGDRTQPSPSRRVKLSARNRYNAALKLVRRGHLLTGLFMIPWIFLYGVSAFLFNHPSAFTDREVRSIGPAETAGTGFESFPDAPAIAARVVEVMNAKSSGREFQLVEPGAASFSRDLLATAKGGGTDYRIQLDLGSGLGTVTAARATKGGMKDDVVGTAVQLADSPRDRLIGAMPALTSRLGLDSTTATLKTFPDVVFAAESHGKVYRLTYNLRSGAVSAQEDGDSAERLTTRSFLTQLHKKREYPGHIDARWFWAVGVDATSALMVFWGASGLLMWWQVKSMRRWGAFVLAASAMAAAALALGMHRVLSIL
jgi:hypothetical protein